MLEEGKEDTCTGEITKHELDISADELKTLQALDPTLGDVRTAAKDANHKTMEDVGFFYKDDLLYRRWIPLQVRCGEISGREKISVVMDQLVLPQKCRGKVMELAHSIPLAGHLGKKKTTD